MENNIIVGVSGGPDSIYLLNKLNNEQQFTLIAVHVNYHLRKDSNLDQKLVENFCHEKGIKLIIKNIKKEDWKKFSFLKNKQSIAREQRYEEYISAAKNNNTKYIYIAHHADDWLETAIMQRSRSEDYLFFGIREKINYHGYTIQRPLLNMFKEDIIKYLKKNNIKFIIDKTNETPIYERNKLRITLLNISKKEKLKKIEDFNKINISKEEINREVENVYKKFIDVN
ncbi:MAG: tRNA lysidine(34) synthetase TilS, partial [Mycoplasmataceae bacterium]|nr:tRNA lysidine(34) synthetase TilS [Mycoplasmataceae bacterium]